MNKLRRARLTAIIDQMHKLEREADAIADELRDLSAEETDAYDNLPESLQSGPGGEAIQDNINAIDDAASVMESVAQDADNAAIALGDNVH